MGGSHNGCLNVWEFFNPLGGEGWAQWGTKDGI